MLKFEKNSIFVYKDVIFIDTVLITGERGHLLISRVQPVG